MQSQLSKLLFSAPCEVCKDENCNHAVKKFETGRWYITFGHCGFNSTANNGNGYASKNNALAAMRRYLNK